MNRLFVTGEYSPPSSPSSPSSYVSPFSPDYEDSDADSAESLADRRDLVLARLLRHACSGNGPLADSLKDLTSELVKLDVISDRVAWLATEQTSGFDKNFYDSFKEHMATSKIPLFWKTDLDTEQTSKTLSSRYLNDFEELKELGRGGYGAVVLCKNKLDMMSYAVKKIPLKNGRDIFNKKISREVAALSRLQHRHVVRYYQAWFEVHIGCDSDNSGGSSYDDGLQEEVDEVETDLFIQMEYCPSMLDRFLNSKGDYDENQRSKIFRQIVQGLAHIHAQGFVHRDLTPKNIFFDPHSDIKIGDFGLVKFLKQEEPRNDLDPEGTLGVSDSPTTFGTYFYTAPEVVEIQKKNLQTEITVKADIYSLGIIFLELMHPCCEIDRHENLIKLKNDEIIPEVWASNHPKKASMLRRMISKDPSRRPSARELLEDLEPIPSFLLRLQDDDLRQVRTY